MRQVKPFPKGMQFAPTLAQRLSQLREFRNMTVLDLARSSRFSRQRIEDLEAGLESWLSSTDRQLLAKALAVEPKLLQKVEKRYDYIIIDLPPSLGIFMVNALVASERIIIPMQCEYYAMEGLAELLQTVRLINKNLKAKTEILGALLTMYDRTSSLNRAVAKEMKKNFPGYLFESVIPKNVKLAEAPSHGKSILQHAPYSHGAKAYHEFAKEVIEILESK